MTVRYVTTDDFDSIVDASVRADLYDDGAGFSTVLFARAAELASTLARSAASNAGYESGDSVTESEAVDMVKALALSAMVRLAYGRKGRTVPEATAEVLGALLAAVQVGDLPIPGLTPDPADAVGGVEGSDRTIATGHPQVFKDIGGSR